MIRRFIDTLKWKAISPLQREDGELLVVERNRFTGAYRVTINTAIHGGDE